MIVLDSGDKLRGDAAAASVVDYTIYGLDNNSLKQLADGQLADSTGDLYTADSVDVISTIIIVNTDSSARAINLFVLPSGGTARRVIAKDLALGAGYSLHWAGDKISVMNASGEIVTTTSGSSGVATSGTPEALDIARFTDADTIEGLSYSELKAAIGYLTDLVDDTTPQLGGNLDVNGKSIVSVSDGNIVLAPNGTGQVVASGAMSLGDNILLRPKIKDYGESVNALGDLSGGTDDIDLEDGNVVTATVSTAEQTFTFSNPSASGTACSFTLILTNGGSQTVNWPASVDWAGGTAPSLTSSGVDVVTFATVDGGTTWYGFAAGLAMA